MSCGNRDYKRMYSIYKKKVESNQKVIAKLHEEVQGMTQVLRANEAIITAILVHMGATEEKPLDVCQETIKMALEGRYKVMSRYDQETMAHKVFYGVPEVRLTSVKETE